MPNVIAKPFTGPDPNANKIIAAIKVVIFASRTVIFALNIPSQKHELLIFLSF